MDTIELLTNYNLTRQEAVIYLALLTTGKLTGYEAAKQTGISRSNVYTALAGLVDKGAAYVMEGKATYYTPVNVNEFCDNALRQFEAIKENLVKKIPRPRVETEGYVTIKGEFQITDKLKNLLLHAKQRIYISLSKKQLERFKPQLEEALIKGLKLVIITNPPFGLPGATIHHTTKELSHVRLIVDSLYVLAGDIEENADCTCLYSSEQNLVDLLKEALKNEIKLIEIGKTRE